MRAIILLGTIIQVYGYIPINLRPHCGSLHLQMVEKETTGMNPLVKSSWYAVEVFGKMFGRARSNEGPPNLKSSPKSLEETLKRIELDNNRSYFLSGEVDKLIYDENCIFSDPFVSFSGRDRFVDNLKNLGSFVTKYDAKVMRYTVKEGELEVDTKVMVKLELNLPWKPILAWPWGVTYEIDKESFLIISHKESWDIDPYEGVKQIFRKPILKI